MEITCVAFIATSLDGFIAKEDGNIDWLHNPRYEIPGEDFGYEKHIQHIDALVMGRKTYELAISFDNWPYTGKDVFVLSTKNISIPSQLSSSVRLISGNLNDQLRELENLGYNRLYIDGGNTIQGFIKECRLNEITITRIPILLGRGIPLFGDVDRDIHLKHLDTQSFENGFVQSRYAIEYHV